jgi:lipoprotein-anchoring transpeptidase ErfK/SrfK
MSKRVLITLIPGLSCVALAILSTSCGPATTGPVTRERPRQELYKWYDDGGGGKVTVRISLTDQIAEFKRGGREIGWCYVATGKEGHSTGPGSYSITEKIVDKYSNLYGWTEDEYGNVIDNDARSKDPVPAGLTYVPAPMPYWMRLTSYGIGMHGGIIPQPGEPASHGCIRLPKDFVPIAFDSVAVGTPVTITNSPSIQGPYRETPPTPEFLDEGPAPRYEGPAPQYRPAPYPAQRVEREWSPGNGGQSAESVTYRNGVPVSYR